MSEIVFTSSLGLEHRDELERLLFFNDNQSRASEGVMFVARRYGLPRISANAERLRVELDSEVQTQTLFAVHRTTRGDGPIGVVVYTREEDAFVVLFVALHEEFSIGGAMADRMLLVRMKDEVAAIARRVRGISTLVMYTGRPRPIRIALHRPAE